MKGMKFIYAHRFEGVPKESDLQLVEEELPALKDGEVLCEVLCLSIDPYLRPIARIAQLKEGDDMINKFVAGKVLETKDEAFPVGTIVAGPMNCKTHAVLPTSDLVNLDYLEDLPVSIGIGAAGMPGLTAYFGVLNVLQPKEGETLYVNSAAGACGALAGQIAKIKGCRVVGSAGSDEKIAFCKSIGFDEVFNYKTVPSLEEALKSACPNGIDMFFENVGGPGFATVVKQINQSGRVALCGTISTYNTTNPEKCEDILWDLIFHQIKVEGFKYPNYPAEVPAARKQLVQWIKEGKIKAKEHVTKGFENLPKAFVELFSGGNLGKAVLMV